MTVHVGDLRARASRVQKTFEEGRAALHRSDGERRFSDAEHAERLNALRAERNQVLREVEEELRAAFEETSAQITNLENRDPTELLASDELALANQKRGFASDAAETLDIQTLKARLESVLASNEKGSIFAHWMAGQKRREKILEGRRENARSAGGANPAASSQIHTFTELDSVLGRMHEALDEGRTAAAIEAARTRLQELADVERGAYFSRNETSSVYNPNYAVPGR